MKGEGNNNVLPYETMNTTNVTHSLYDRLIQTQNSVLEALAGIARRYPVEKAQEYLSAFLQGAGLLPDEPLNYPRLWALLNKNLAGCDLHGEDFSGMTLDQFTFAGATLDGANLTGCRLTGARFDHASCREVAATGADLSSATLTQANWSCADCTGATLAYVDASDATFVYAHLEHADLFHADLRQANLRGSWLDWSELDGTNLEGADLRGCLCATAHFGTMLRFNADTVIDPRNHTLISMALLSRASTVEQRQFALYIRYRTGFCWPDFTRLLVRQRALAPWVKEALGGVRSLTEKVEHYAAELSQLLEEGLDLLNLSDVNLPLHTLVRSEIEQHAFVRSADLYWYLRGILEMASRQPGMELSAEQKQLVLWRLQAFTRVSE